MMGGEIDVESQVGEGTTFFFTAEFGIARRQKLRRPGDLAALQGTPVLVVDDNETNHRILHEILESWNLHPLTAASGTEGLQLIEESRARGQSIPLVLLDCMMPDMDGFDFAGKLRETVCSEECTLIMVSSAIQVGDSERCRQRQIARCMAKPVKHSELLNAILIEFHQEPEGEPDEETALFHADDVQPRRVLLAEDGLVNQRVAIGFLKQRGHQVEVAADGREAVDAVSREPFDVVLMDVQMPEMDGFAATSAIRRQERGTGRHLPIIAMTANAMKGDRERCLEAGMDDYVSKPVDPAALFKAVESAPAGVLADENVGEQPAAEQKPDDAAEQKPEGPAGQKPDGAAEGKSEKKPVAAEPHARPRSAHARPRSEHARPRSEEETAAAESARELDQPSTAVDAETGSAAGTSSAGSGDGDPRKTPPAETTGQLIDWEATTQRMPGGEKVARDMAGMLREEAPKCLAQIRQAQQERDAETLRRAAHTLKGSLAIFELDDMVVLSEEMESYGKAGDFGAAGKLLPGMEAAVSRLTDELAGYVESS